MIVKIKAFFEAVKAPNFYKKKSHLLWKVGLFQVLSSIKTS
jgi:hypothetical protein